MTCNIKVGDSVVAIRDGDSFSKGTRGMCSGIGSIECELYLNVRIDKYLTIGPTLSDYWMLYGDLSE